MNLKEALGTVRAFDSPQRTVIITQSFAAFPLYKPHPAFQDWINKLKKGERLPRGRFFAGKKSGTRLSILDEFNLGY